MELPKISIITPSYNQGRFLESCILSVVEQAYPNLEYFIIDGGSSDASLDVIHRHESHIDFWVSESDEGQSDAINKGFAKSSGVLVTWLNADDFLLPGALLKIADAYTRNPKASFYFGDGWRVDSEGQFKSGFFPQNNVVFDYKAFVYGLNHILQPAAFINRAYVEETALLNPGLHYGLDSELWLRLAQRRPPCPVQAFLAASREYEGTKTDRGSFERVEELRQIASKFSGSDITPGVMCYFLDTLHRCCQERPDLFGDGYLKAVERFWGATAESMALFGARPDGFPVCKK